MDVLNLKKLGEAIPQLYRYETIARANDHTFTLVRVKDRTLDFHSHPESDEVFSSYPEACNWSFGTKSSG